MVKVLFVCLGNSCRSQLAEAFARRLGLGVLDVHSAGTAPSKAVNPRALAALSNRGYDAADARPRSIDEVPPGPYEWMIRMGCGDLLLVPALHREDWDYPPPSQLAGGEFDQLCTDLEARVHDFVERARAWAEATGFVLHARPAQAPTSPAAHAPALDLGTLDLEALDSIVFGQSASEPSACTSGDGSSSGVGSPVALPPSPSNAR